MRSIKISFLGVAYRVWLPTDFALIENRSLSISALARELARVSFVLDFDSQGQPLSSPLNTKLQNHEVCILAQSKNANKCCTKNRVTKLKIITSINQMKCLMVVSLNIVIIHKFKLE